MNNKTLKVVSISAVITLAGCGTSVPECNDVDAKALAIKIVKQNNAAEALNSINNRIERYTRQIDEIEAERITSQQSKDQVLYLQDAHEGKISRINARFVNEQATQTAIDQITAEHEQRVSELKSRFTSDQDTEKAIAEIKAEHQQRVKELEAKIKTAMTEAEREAEIAKLTAQIKEFCDAFVRGIAKDSRHEYCLYRPYSIEGWLMHGWDDVKEYWNWKSAHEAFKKAYRDSDAAKMAELNTYIKLPADNRDAAKFAEVAEKHGWEGTKYANGKEAYKAYKGWPDELKSIREFNVSEQKREVDAHNANIQQQLDNASQTLEQAIAAKRQEADAYNADIQQQLDNASQTLEQKIVTKRQEVDTTNANLQQQIADAPQQLEQAIAEVKRNRDAHNQQTEQRMAQARQELEEWQAMADYVNDGKFSLQTIRTLNIDEQIGRHTCEAQLQFKHPTKTHTTKINYIVELTGDDQLYVEARFDDVYGL